MDGIERRPKGKPVLDDFRWLEEALAQAVIKLTRCTFGPALRNTVLWTSRTQGHAPQGRENQPRN